jgi:hypothetical protein
VTWPSGKWCQRKVPEKFPRPVRIWPGETSLPWRRTSREVRYGSLPGPSKVMLRCCHQTIYGNQAPPERMLT